MAHGFKRAANLGKPRPPTEEQEQRTLALWLNLHPLILWTHPPNGGERNKIVAAKLKAMGVRPGVVDVLIFTAPRRTDVASIYTLDQRTVSQDSRPDSRGAQRRDDWREVGLHEGRNLQPGPQARDGIADQRAADSVKPGADEMVPEDRHREDPSETDPSSRRMRGVAGVEGYQGLRPSEIIEGAPLRSSAGAPTRDGSTATPGREGAASLRYASVREERAFVSRFAERQRAGHDGEGQRARAVSSVLFAAGPKEPEAAIVGIGIELKRRDATRSDVARHQVVFMERLAACGWLCFVARGAGEAIDELERLGYGTGARR